jgi:hypothetical protein
MRSLPVKLVLCAGLAAMAFAALPSAASAHYLTTRQATQNARAACNQISQNENTPYICRGVVDRSRRSAHRVNFLLDLYDPNDGEECSAVLRIYVRAGSRRIRGTIVDHDCIVRPTFNRG